MVKIVKVDTSLEGVIKQTAASIVYENARRSPEVVAQIIHRGRPPADASEDDIRNCLVALVLDSVTAGVAIVLHGILTGQLDIALIKQKIK